MRIKYVGGRSTYEVTIGRKATHFNKENGRTIETSDKNLINYIFSLPNRQEFEVVENVVLKAKAEEIPSEAPENKKGFQKKGAK